MQTFDRNLYHSVRSTESSSIDMLGNYDIDNDNRNMTQIEMYNTFIQPSTTQLKNDNESKQLLSSKNRDRNNRLNENVSILERLQRCRRNRKKSIDNRERSIHYNDNGYIKVYRNDKQYSVNRFVRNTINNQKYSVLTFIPLFLFEQFNQFWNLYFLFIAITQLPIKNSIFEDFWIGYWWTTVLPLVFVVSISMIRELFDDIQRKRRDYLINYEKYEKINIKNGLIESIASCNIGIGDLIILNEGNRVPCDMILLYCENENGSTFIKTDQLDGETDWKLRRAIPSIQKYYNAENIIKLNGILTIQAPHLDIYKFIGKFEHLIDNNIQALNLENTLWGSTRIASEGICIGCCIYLGSESRQQLNANDKTIKIGLIDRELNRVTKILVFMLILISFILTVCKGIHLNSYLYFGRFLLILSDIIPLSLRVYMDLCKIWFSWMIAKDKLIPNTTVRCTTIPEELGRIQYLFSDKTGTLTKNEMIFQKLQLKPPLLFQSHNYKLIHNHFINEILNSPTKKKRKKAYKKKMKNTQKSLLGIDELQIKLQIELQNKNKKIKTGNNNLIINNNNNNKCVSLQVFETIEALAICHNVTPIINQNENITTYEASSPDEIAMVKFTEKCGIKLIYRTTEEIILRIYENIGNNYDDIDYKYDDEDYIDLKYEILHIFPFTSESKRMGIIIKSIKSEQIIFYAKGADIVMKNMIESIGEEWMDEEVENLSREGLRTLVFTKRQLTFEQYNNFLSKYNKASISMNSETRKIQMESIRQNLLEQDMELLCITGVEDKLQNNVQSTIEILRNAHIKIWMLTGDKIETAKVIARSSRLISYGQEIYELIIKNKRDAYHKLDILYGKNNSSHNLAIVIDGNSLDIFMNSGDTNLKQQFLEYIINCNVVISCRCSPTQKADIVQSVQRLTKKICCAIGDGGNDVSMILAANVGIGILGREGQQASLSSDFSIIKFEYLSILLLWHGRTAYKNTSVKHKV